MHTSPFDELAAEYDRSFTHSRCGGVLRAMVWERLAARFAGRQRILELGCGTGEDAIFLARRGHHVLAIDASAEMIRCARLKAVAAGCVERIDFRVLGIESLEELRGEAPFDGAFSSFGAINCVADVTSLARRLAGYLPEGSPLLLVAMGRHVPWEWLWFGARGEFAKAFRRLPREGAVWRGMRIFYPTPAGLTEALRPGFSTEQVRALGSILPPSYAMEWLDRRPALLRRLAALERRLATSSLSASLADHYMLEARRREPSLLETPRGGLARRLVKRAADLGHRMLGHRRYDAHRVEHVGDLRIVVRPTVANPRLLRSGAFFASTLDGALIGAETRVLDLGTGSGVCALRAARFARAVTAVDINTQAVRCARLNAGLNGLRSRVRVLHGDLFTPVAGRRFDLVLFNPPFVDEPAADARDAAWRGLGLATRFAADLGPHLAPGGVALLLLSSWGDACPKFEAELRANGFRLSVFAVRRYLGETLTILRVCRA
jgi:HemK-related putative methylase